MNRLRAIEIVTEKASKDDLDKKYGLEKPAYKVVITIAKDKKPTTHEYDFGKEVAGKGVYAKLGGKDTIYLVPLEVLSHIKKEVLDPTIFSFKVDDVVAVKCTGWQALLGSPTSLSVEQKDGKWALAANSAVKFTLDPDKVANLLNGLAHRRAERFVASGTGLKLDDDAFQIAITWKDKRGAGVGRSADQKVRRTMRRATSSRATSSWCPGPCSRPPERSPRISRSDPVLLPSPLSEGRGSGVRGSVFRKTTPHPQPSKGPLSTRERGVRESGVPCPLSPSGASGACGSCRGGRTVGLAATPS